MTNGVWEPYTFRILDVFLDRPTIPYLDIGAWIGPTVLYAARKVDRVWAIEPDRVAYAALLTNLRLNECRNVRTFNLAILDRDGIARLGSDCLGNSMTRITNSENSFYASCRTLDSFMYEQGLGDDTFIKMDVEGAEEFILRGLQRYRPTIYVSLHPFWWSEGDTWDVVRAVAALYPRCYDVELHQLDLAAGDQVNGDGLIFTDRVLPV